MPDGPAPPRNSNICSDPGNLSPRGGRFLSGARRRFRNRSLSASCIERGHRLVERIEAAARADPRYAFVLLPDVTPPISSKDPAGISHLEQSAQKLGDGCAGTGLEVGQEVRMPIDRRHRGNLRSHVFEHSNYCSAVIETSEPGGQPDTGPSV